MLLKKYCVERRRKRKIMDEYDLLKEIGRNSIHFIYYDMVEKLSKNINAYKKALKSIYNRLDLIDYIDDDIKEDNVYDQEYKLIRKLEKIELRVQQDSISCIVFSALAIEAYIYDYGARRLGDVFVKDHIDKLDLISKIIIILKLVLFVDFPKDSKIYFNLKNLIKSRNNLVHYKSRNQSDKTLMEASDLRDVEFVELLKNALQAHETIINFAKFMIENDSRENAVCQIY